MKIAIATDHNGVIQKQEIINKLTEFEFIDKSPVNTPTDDYPDFAYKVCKAVINKDADFGILLCGTGIGMSIAANKIKGIRCARCTSLNDAHLAKEHNHANVIALAYTKKVDELVAMIKEFVMTSEDPDERHLRRIKKISDIENGAYNEL